MMHLTPELIEKLDTFAPSPNVSASKIYEHLKEWDEFNEYEITCFCIEFLGAQLISGQLKYTESNIKQLTKDFYFAHYLKVAEGISKWNPTKQADVTSEDHISNGPSQDSNDSLTTK